HRLLGIALLLPLTATALTGMAYKFGKDYLGISEETADFLMHIHEGAWLGKELKVFYVLIMGLGLLTAGLLGLGILLPKKRRSP
ncbi:MAG: PepSY domain-containing protein, partial [Spartobacteria bacterium]